MDIRESGEKHTIQAVRPENPEKNMQSKPSGPEIRKSEKKPTIQTVLLVALLLVGCRQPTQRPPRTHAQGQIVFISEKLIENEYYEISAV